MTIANYTYTKSNIKVGATDPVAAYPLRSDAGEPALPRRIAADRAVGPSGHLEFGLEQTGKVSQQTFLLSYASTRVTRRGPSGQPDIMERPGFHLDFVARQAVRLFGIDTEMKLEVRNITGTRYQEFQQSGPNIVYYNLYDVGRTVTFGLNLNF